MDKAVTVTNRYLPHFCAFCEKPFRAVRRDAQYCSRKCKQALYRRRVDFGVGSIARFKQQRAAIVESRRAALLYVVCEQCQREFMRSNNQPNKIYCTPACKQRAYRARKVQS